MVEFLRLPRFRNFFINKNRGEEKEGGGKELIEDEEKKKIKKGI